MQYSDFPAYRTKWGYRTNHVDENAVEPCKIGDMRILLFLETIHVGEILNE
jgi:hypothetical protein